MPLQMSWANFTPSLILIFNSVHSRTHTHTHTKRYSRPYIHENLCIICAYIHMPTKGLTLTKMANSEVSVQNKSYVHTCIYVRIYVHGVSTQAYNLALDMYILYRSSSLKKLYTAQIDLCCEVPID